MRIDKESNFRKNGRIMCKNIDGTDVLIDPYRRTLVHLNPTASLIWRLLDGERSCAGIIEALREEFEAGDKQIEADVVSLLKELLKREMIE